MADKFILICSFNILKICVHPCLSVDNFVRLLKIPQMKSRLF